MDEEELIRFYVGLADEGSNVKRYTFPSVDIPAHPAGQPRRYEVTIFVEPGSNKPRSVQFAWDGGSTGEVPVQPEPGNGGM